MTIFGDMVFHSGGVPASGELTTGDIFFVHSGTGSNANSGKKPSSPFAGIDHAINNCTANKGDIIYVMPGHDENPTTSITADVAGIWIRGLGWGTNRPTITFGGIGATLAITASSVRVSGLRFDLGTVAATVTCAITITGDAAIVEGCETVVHATSQFTSLLSATDAQFVKIYNNKFHSLSTASATSGLLLDGCDDIEIVGNQVAGHFTEHAVDNTTAGSVDEILRAYIAYNAFRNDSTTASDLTVELDAAATGFFIKNMLHGGLATTDANFDIGNMGSLESYVLDDFGVDVHGIVLGSAAT